jgi:septal ring factor EnvC (AmiA/AmiB activator)
MSQIDAVQNQFVIAGEPVGTMAPPPRGGATQRSSTDPDGAPILYIEFKKDQRTIDPDPWFAPSDKKNAQLITPNVIPPQFTPG